MNSPRSSPNSTAMTLTIPWILPLGRSQGLSLEESRKLLVGITHSLKNTLCKLSLDHVVMKSAKSELSTPSGSEHATGSPDTDASGKSDRASSATSRSPSLAVSNAGQFRAFSFRTSAYQLHYLETPTGWRFILQNAQSFTPSGSIQGHHQIKGHDEDAPLPQSLRILPIR